MNGIRAPVGIVGGGPAGLMTAIELGSRGVRCVLFEEEVAAPWLPKANSSTARTMEHYRRHGIAEAVRDVGLAEDHPQDVAYFTRYGTGYELARLKGRSRREVRNWTGVRNDEWPTPEPVSRSNQVFVEPVLRHTASGHPGVEIMLGRRVTGIEPCSDHVRVQVEDLNTGHCETHGFSYLAGCDGARSSVRMALGIRHKGVSNEERRFMGGQMLATRLHAPAFYDIVRGERAWQHLAMNHERRSIMGALDGAGQFTFHTQLPVGVEAGEDWVRESLALTVGRDFPYEILAMAKWTAGLTLVAERFRDQRVFLVGDAAHLFTPTGGLGYNTSIEDAVNLGWKIAAMCNGWGGSELLASYQDERRPIAVRNTRFARSLADNLGNIEIVPQLEDDTDEGRRLRLEMGERLLHHATIEFNTQGIQLGVQYCASPIIELGNAVPPVDDPHLYVPTATPGCRAPHLWLDRTRSIFDEFGPDFTLLQLDRAKDAKPLVEAARSMGIPLRVLRLKSEEARELYGADLTLIRPDHHVAWRSDSLPSEPESLLRKITGG
ncbi:MAG: FAD-dependent monooxygenase [Defluviicoccus sp.]|nr:FAD-dependent monooxygenase [Defluviicoccus sp.]